MPWKSQNQYESSTKFGRVNVKPLGFFLLIHKKSVLKWKLATFFMFQSRDMIFKQCNLNRCTIASRIYIACGFYSGFSLFCGQNKTYFHITLLNTLNSFVKVKTEVLLNVKNTPKLNLCVSYTTDILLCKFTESCILTS